MLIHVFHVNKWDKNSGEIHSVKKQLNKKEEEDKRYSEDTPLDVECA